MDLRILQQSSRSRQKLLSFSYLAIFNPEAEATNSVSAISIRSITLNIRCPTQPNMSLPTLPVPHSQFIPYLAKQDVLKDALKPYKTYESKLREIFAQEPANAITADPHANILPLFDGYEKLLKVRARDMKESIHEKDKYLLPLPDTERKPNNSQAIVSSMKEFKNNFNLFSESSLVDLDWSNVIAAGSSVVTSLLPVKVSYGLTNLDPVYQSSQSVP
jgi:hypothetical protein